MTIAVFDTLLKRDFLLAWARHKEREELDDVATSRITISAIGAEIPQHSQVNLRYAQRGEAQSHVMIDPFQPTERKGAGRALLRRLNLEFGVKMVLPYLDKYRCNLTRIRFDGVFSHWRRERFNKRRRFTVYKKTPWIKEALTALRG